MVLFGGASSPLSRVEKNGSQNRNLGVYLIYLMDSHLICLPTTCVLRKNLSILLDKINAKGILQKTGKEKFSEPRGLISGRDTSAIGYSGRFLRHSLANKPGPS